MESKKEWLAHHMVDLESSGTFWANRSPMKANKKSKILFLVWTNYMVSTVWEPTGWVAALLQETKVRQRMAS